MKNLKTFTYSFWFLNVFQMLEKLAYWCVLLQLPIFIAQKDAGGGLHWEQTVKGVIFFWWALFQNLTPLISGAFSDKFGHKKSIIASYFLIIPGYILLALHGSYELFLAGAIILGIGSGIFKPALQGSISAQLNKTNSSLGWGIYFMLLNLAVFFVPPLSKYLKEISFTSVFIGSISISIVNLVLVWILPKDNFFHSLLTETTRKTLRKIFINLFKPEVFWLVLIMSGFAIIYMQFYETLPNFIYDWSNTSAVASSLHLPRAILTETSRGLMISYEWLYNINALIVIGGVALSSYFLSKYNKHKVILFGILISTLGLFLCGISFSGGILITGMVVYSIGEMITNPKLNEVLGTMSSKEDKGLFMSYLNVSLALGLGFGSLLGGYLYKSIGEKSVLAMKYLNEHFPQIKTEATNSMISLQKVTGLSQADLTALLWNNYEPWKFWVVFLIIGIISVIGMIFYSSKFPELK